MDDAASDEEQSDYGDPNEDGSDNKPIQSTYNLGDWGPDARDRYNAIIADSGEEDQTSCGSDNLLLKYVITDERLDDCISHLSKPRSRIWYDRTHPRWPIPTEECCDFLPRDRRQPWGKWGLGDGLEYAPPGEPDRLSVSTGISFPKIEPQHGEFRLLVLLPHNGDLSSTVRSYLMVSVLFLHSCYIAVRHSRGNPAVRGGIVIDNLPVKVSKNLETFLQHIRGREVARVRWIREACINKHDEDERQRNFNPGYQWLVEDCSPGLVAADLLSALRPRLACDNFLDVLLPACLTFCKSHKRREQVSKLFKKGSALVVLIVVVDLYGCSIGLRG